MRPTSTSRTTSRILDELWFNDGHGKFRLADWTSQRQMSNSTMGVDVADVNGDGLPDLFSVDMLANDSHRLKTQIPTHTAFPKKPGEMELQLQQQRNSLFLNRGDGTFAEVSQFAGVRGERMVVGHDVHGRRSRRLAGHSRRERASVGHHGRGHAGGPAEPADRGRLADDALGVSDAQAEERRVPQPRRPDVRGRRAQKWHFGARRRHLAHAGRGGPRRRRRSRRRREPARLAGARAAQRCVGAARGGATRRRRAEHARRWRRRFVCSAAPFRCRSAKSQVGGLYMSHSDYEASFAMGKSDSATIVVDWRDGTRTTIRGVRPNREYEITPSTAVARPADRFARITPALFEDATAQLEGTRTPRTSFDDWDRQFLLPNALSQLGPGVRGSTSIATATKT